MAASLFEHGAIRTTEVKAKELRRFVEKLITIAKSGLDEGDSQEAKAARVTARRRVFALMRDRAMVDEDGDIADQTVLQKLFSEIAPRYVDRPGGYTRIIRLAERRIGDAGVQVVLQLVEEEGVEAEGAAGSSRRKQRAEKRHRLAKRGGKGGAATTVADAEESIEAAEVAEEAAEAVEESQADADAGEETSEDENA